MLLVALAHPFLLNSCDPAGSLSPTVVCRSNRLPQALPISFSKIWRYVGYWHSRWMSQHAYEVKKDMIDSLVNLVLDGEYYHALRCLKSVSPTFSRDCIGIVIKAVRGTKLCSIVNRDWTRRTWVRIHPDIIRAVSLTLWTTVVFEQTKLSRPIPTRSRQRWKRVWCTIVPIFTLSRAHPGHPRMVNSPGIVPFPASIWYPFLDNCSCSVACSGILLSLSCLLVWRRFVKNPFLAFPRVES
jgi:hypothetical protein